MKDLVSIIVPVYEVKKYLKKCIESLINQTYTNLEILLIDDGSTDGSSNICNDYAIIDKRIQVIHKENEGVSKARNKGIEIAKGDYITFVDADDYIDTHYIETLYNDCIINKSDISIIGVKDINEENVILRESKSMKKTLDFISAFKELMCEKYYTSVVWGKMYNKDLFNNVRFNIETKIGEDLEIIYKIFEKANRISINTEKKLYYCLMRNNSATAQQYNDKWKGEINICQNIINYMKEKHPKSAKYAIRRYIRINVTCIMKIIQSDDIDKNIKKIENLKNNINKYSEDKYFKQTFANKVKIFLIYKNIYLLQKIYKTISKLKKK